jgi:hypothetical protein
MAKPENNLLSGLRNIVDFNPTGFDIVDQVCRITRGVNDGMFMIKTLVGLFTKELFFIVEKAIYET